MRVWGVLIVSAVVTGCVAPTPTQQALLPPAAVPASPTAPGGKRITYNGAGGFVLPDGTLVAAEPGGGFTLPNGARAVPDGGGGITLPNGARCLSDRAGGFICP
jgi:hypothetical protein